MYMEDPSEISFQSKDSETAWLKGCYTGYLKTDFYWEENGEEIQCECAGKIKLTNMGSNIMLIQSLDGDHLEKILSDLDEW